jgi:hypothetical protein
MLFPRCGEAVAAWQIVAEAGRAGQIWCAKIAPRATSNGHLICVYTPDLTDRREVEAVAIRLDNLGLVHRPVYNKPDIFTYAGIYNASGTIRERASIYEYRPGDGCVRATPALSRAYELLAISPGST